MKYLLILYICTINNTSALYTCSQDQVVNEKFENYYECITKGYLHSYSYLTTMYPEDAIENNKLAIKFQCKEITEEA